MKLFVSFLLLLSGLIVNAQNPPEPAQPLPYKKALIDTLMIVSKFKQYFVEFCDQKIEKIAEEKKWNFDQVRERKLKVNFEEFMEYTVYNIFSSLTEDELNALTNLMGKINLKNKYFYFMITNKAIQSNLELFVERYLK